MNTEHDNAAKGSKVPAEGDKNALLSGWIDVEDNEPEEEVFVLVATENRRVFVDLMRDGMFDYDSHCESMAAAQGVVQSDYITHWMPLPDAPAR